MSLIRNHMRLAILKRKIFNYLPEIALEPYKLLRLYYWHLKEGCCLPAPHFVKQAVLLRNGIKNSTWIETGTYLGDTTYFLSKNFPTVHTIEPSIYYRNIAKSLIKKKDNIIFHEGTSEECFESICLKVTGDVSFWLDGHFSGGNTFKNNSLTPIKFELEIIKKNIKKLNNICVLIDDARCSFVDEGYPSLDYYVEWAKSLNLKWIIEHDIFIAKSGFYK